MSRFDENVGRIHQTAEIGLFFLEHWQVECSLHFASHADLAVFVALVVEILGGGTGHYLLAQVPRRQVQLQTSMRLKRLKPLLLNFLWRLHLLLPITLHLWQ